MNVQNNPTFFERFKIFIKYAKYLIPDFDTAVMQYTSVVQYTAVMQYTSVVQYTAVVQ